MAREIIIEGVQAITERTVITCPEEGLKIFKGPNGAGKSTALQVINALAAGDASLMPSDGASHGYASGFGRTLNVGLRRNTQAGELEVEMIADRLSIADLIEPPVKDPAAADGIRIKALLSLVGVKAEASLFHKLVGGQEDFDKLISLASIETDDPVTMAKRIKRDFEKHAREFDEAAKKELLAAEAARQTIADIDLNAPDDPVKLQEDLELCLSEDTRLKTERRAALEAAEKLDQARASLATSEQTYTGLSVADAEAKAAGASAILDAANRTLTAAEEAVRVAREEHARAQLSHEAAMSALTNAREHERLMAQWRKDVGVELPTSTVTDEQLVNAAEDVRQARETLQQGLLVAKAKQTLDQVGQHMRKAAALKTKHDQLRMAAQGTDDVLSELVQRLPNCPLKVKDGRLVTPTDRSPEEKFSDLSRGEKAFLVVRHVAVPAIGRGGAFTIPQRFFEGLDLTHRRIIDKALHGTGVVAFTAECDAHEEPRELRTEAFESNGNGVTA
jgi:hypothetical protein